MSLTNGFTEFKKRLQENVDELLNNTHCLFTVDIDKDKLWELYLDSFPEGTNNIFRKRREYDCSCCRQFIKNFGNVVVIKDNKICTIWDFDSNSVKYQQVIDALSKYIKSSKIKDVFLTNEKSFGTNNSKELTKDNKVIIWDHFYIKLPKKHITKSNKTLPTLIGNLKSDRNVFKRSLEELTKDSIKTVLELIDQKSLYKGEEWKSILTSFLEEHNNYSKLPENEKENYCWIRSLKVGSVISKIKNHSIGVLLSNISKGMDLNIAVSKYEAIVAPTNYKRPKAIFTKKMIENAQKEIIRLGLLNSLSRKHSVIEDITVNNILFANRDTTNVLTNTVFDELKTEVKVNEKKFDRIEEVNIDDFIKNILPKVSNIELLLDSKHESNLVSLISPINKDAKTMFKWNNNFSWAYNGNITDSMKERVKKAGGKVDGVLRFSIQWNDNKDNNNDFDAHCIEPYGNRIYYSTPVNIETTGNLDVDIRIPFNYKNGNEPSVENITWTNINKMLEGEYEFFVYNYAYRGGRSGFSAEIEYDGKIYYFVYDKPLKQGEKVTVAKINFNKKDGIRFIESLPSTSSSKTIWNISTNQFHDVSIMMYSPNYWDEQKGIGNKHYFFMLKNCKNETSPNGFFNEFLQEDLMEYKKVFEALGSKMKVPYSDNQLSGLGFSSTKRNFVICKLTGSFTRTIKLTF